MALIKYELIELNPINKVEIIAALGLILASSMFVNTTRMSRLLNFLVNKTLTGMERDISEYVIGIEVFDKNRATYNTYEDSVVRVQTKRLRLKLNVNYASLAVAPDIQITIPTGSYLPVFSRK